MVFLSQACDPVPDYAPVASLEKSLAGSYGAQTVVDDLNANGLNEVIYTVYTGGHYYNRAFEDTGDNSYVDSGWQLVWDPYVDHPFFVCDAGDADGDGLREVVGIRWANSTADLTLFEGEPLAETDPSGGRGPGAPSVAIAQGYPSKEIFVDTLQIYNYAPSVALGDLDQDGHKEVLIATHSVFHVYECSGDDTYVLVYAFDSDYGYGFNDFVSGDFDGDGATDIILAEGNYTGSDDPGFIIALENTADDDYAEVWRTQSVSRSGFKVAGGRLSLGPERFVVLGGNAYTTGTVQRLQVFASDGDDSYRATFTDEFEIPALSLSGVSVGELDLDAFDEVVTKVPLTSSSVAVTVYDFLGNTLVTDWEQVYSKPSGMIWAEGPTISDTDEDAMPELIFKERVDGTEQTSVYELQGISYP